MAEIAGVQGGNINALETTLASLQYRGSHRTWANRTEYAASLTSVTLTLSGYLKFDPQFKQNLTCPLLPQLIRVGGPFTAGFWDI